MRYGAKRGISWHLNASSLAYVLFFIQHISVWLDLRLLACTAAFMIAMPYHRISWVLRTPKPAALTVGSQPRI
jgi:hypothetical protein